MITREVDASSVYARPEDPDDLLSLRRAVRAGDRVTGDTTRVIKRERDYSRPDRGERVRIRVALRVEKMSLDGELGRLRIAGTVQDSDNESVPRGSHHSMIIEPGRGITIAKKSWGPSQRDLLSRRGPRAGFVLAAVDASDCGIARLSGTRMERIPDIRSGVSGKRYRGSFDMAGFLDGAAQAAASVARPGDRVIIFGPGHTKRRLANRMRGLPELQGHDISVIDGVETAGEDGIIEFSRSPAMRRAASGSGLARAAEITDEAVARAGRGADLFAMGMDEASRAAVAGAVGSLVFSDRSVRDDEQGLVDLLDEAERRGADTYAVDSSTDVGLRVSGLGGIVALLRYRM
ncbi:MAG: mRNA surveillance protein Pelota [Nitrosopumilus sp.]|nr:mRNA surveillance protein Pelota [Nitrosopumilus sp.]